MSETIRIGHGGGGKLTLDLIEQLFVPSFRNEALEKLGDSAIISQGGERIAFTADAYVVAPPFFPGGDIGLLAVCGTVNDLAVTGARPEFLSSAVILEEGFPIESLERLVASMQLAADEAGCTIVTGDTKVVGKGKGDGVFVITSGVGPVVLPCDLGPECVSVDDVVLVNGFLGDHAAAVLGARGEFGMEIGVRSDAAPLNGLVGELIDAGIDIKVMRDLTRGGLISAACELCRNQPWGFQFQETAIPIRDAVRGLCEMVGFDPLGMANEGKVLLVVDRSDADRSLGILRAHKYGTKAAIVGTITSDPPGRACLETVAGGTRLLEMSLGEELPRIC